MGKNGKVDLTNFVNANELEVLLDNNAEVTLFIDNQRKYVTIGCDADKIRIVDLGTSSELINMLKITKVPHEVFYGNHLYFVNMKQLTELLTPYILQGRLHYCPSNIAYYSIYQ